MQSLQALESEKFEALIAEVGKALDATGDKRLIEPGVRAKIKASYELDDLQMAVAVQWAPKELIRRRTAPPDHLASKAASETTAPEPATSAKSAGL